MLPTIPPRLFVGTREIRRERVATDDVEAARACANAIAAVDAVVEVWQPVARNAACATG